MGAPKYLEGRDAIENPKILAMEDWVMRGVWKKKTWEFDLLMQAPEASEKSDRIDFSLRAS